MDYLFLKKRALPFTTVLLEKSESKISILQFPLADIKPIWFHFKVAIENVLFLKKKFFLWNSSDNSKLPFITTLLKKLELVIFKVASPEQRIIGFVVRVVFQPELFQTICLYNLLVIQIQSNCQKRNKEKSKEYERVTMAFSEITRLSILTVQPWKVKYEKSTFAFP